MPTAAIASTVERTISTTGGHVEKKLKKVQEFLFYDFVFGKKILKFKIGFILAFASSIHNKQQQDRFIINKQPSVCEACFLNSSF